MKKTLYAILSILMLFFCTTGFAKIPIFPDQVVLSDGAIFLNVEGELLQIAGIVEEEGNLYAIPKPNAWRCNNCHWYNFYGISTCIRCGESREDTGS